ncbi:MAG: hypothetical protein HKL96_02095 [Phycisphaerales bacterium]|nr:hypothetical protein [Phycisphaerales bacterium]
MTSPKVEVAESRRTFLKAGAGVLSGLALAQPSLNSLASSVGQGARKPNIVFFLSEGMRRRDELRGQRDYSYAQY